MYYLKCGRSYYRITKQKSKRETIASCCLIEKLKQRKEEIWKLYCVIKLLQEQGRDIVNICFFLSKNWGHLECVRERANNGFNNYACRSPSGSSLCFLTSHKLALIYTDYLQKSVSQSLSLPLISNLT